LHVGVLGFEKRLLLRCQRTKAGRVSLAYEGKQTLFAIAHRHPLRCHAEQPASALHDFRGRAESDLGYSETERHAGRWRRINAAEQFERSHPSLDCVRWIGQTSLAVEHAVRVHQHCHVGSAHGAIGKKEDGIRLSRP
jgi:hypothetical protein